jgi:hypothetical protein
MTAVGVGENAFTKIVGLFRLGSFCTPAPRRRAPVVLILQWCRLALLCRSFGVGLFCAAGVLHGEIEQRQYGFACERQSRAAIRR